MNSENMSVSKAREAILETASRLFYAHGVHSVGIDRIISESGVAKMTFYKYFPSRANLVAEYVKTKSEESMSLLRALVENAGDDPVERLLALFDAIPKVSEDEEFRGCPCVRSLADFLPAEGDDEIRTAIASHFKQQEDLVRELVAAVGVKEPEALIAGILAILNGAAVMSQTSSASLAARYSKDAARNLVNQYRTA